MGRKRLETGEIAVPGSGDTIHDGGNKIYDNFEELYLAFGDQRLNKVTKSTGEEYITPHATGYYQHLSLSTYASPVASGSMHDIDSTYSVSYFPVILPTISQSNGYARRGEQVVIQDSKGTWGDVPVRVAPASGQSITGANASGYYMLNENYTKATFVVVDDDSGSERWAVRIEGISGEVGANVEQSMAVKTGETYRLDLFNVDNYSSIKLMVYAESKNDDTSVIERRTAYEYHILESGGTPIGVPFAVLNSEDGNNIVVATPVEYVNGNSQTILAVDFTTNEPATNTTYISVKAVGSVKQRL